MKNILVPILICSLLYLAGCTTKEESVKPEQAAAKVPSKPLSARKPRGSNSGARVGYTSWQKFTFNGRPTGSAYIARDIAVGDNPGYDRIYIVTHVGELYYYSGFPSDATFNPATGIWRKANITGLNSTTAITFPACNGRAPKIAVDASGNPWIVDCSGAVYRTRPHPILGSSALEAGALNRGVTARDIAWGNGRLYVTEGTTGNGNIYEYNFFTDVWNQVPGMTGASISADQYGRPWILKENGPAYYQASNGVWYLAGASNGTARDLGASNADWVQCVGTGSSNNVFMYDFPGNYWYQPYGSGWGVRVDTDREGYIYLLNEEPNGLSHVFTH